jgi:hypothetical protein
VEVEDLPKLPTQLHNQTWLLPSKRLRRQAQTSSAPNKASHSKLWKNRAQERLM